MGLEIPRNPRSADLKFKERESRELILGISGAIGGGAEHVGRALRTNLAELSYEVAHRIRFERLQLAGNQLRSARATEFLAELSMAVISNTRISRAIASGDTSVNANDSVPGRVAYIADQLKHPDEVQLLRRVYGNCFTWVGVLASEKQRIQSLSK